MLLPGDPPIMRPLVLENSSTSGLRSHAGTSAARALSVRRCVRMLLVCRIVTQRDRSFTNKNAGMLRRPVR